MTNVLAVFPAEKRLRRILCILLNHLWLCDMKAPFSISSVPLTEMLDLELLWSHYILWELVCKWDWVGSSVLAVCK